VTQQLSVGFLGVSHLHPATYMLLFQAIAGATVIAAADSTGRPRSNTSTLLRSWLKNAANPSYGEMFWYPRH